MKILKLTKGKYTLVDDGDYDWLNQWKWYCRMDKFGNGYAVRRSKSMNGKRKVIYMHRLLNNTIIGFETDHINRNRLDNRKSNLRTVTHSQNIVNSKLHKNNTSGYTGIIWHKQGQKWNARIQVNKKNISLGCYSDIQEAIFARKLGEQKYFGEIL